MRMTIGELRGLIREVVEGVVSERGVVDNTVTSARAGFDFLRRAANAFQSGGFENARGEVDSFVADLRMSRDLSGVVDKIEEIDAGDDL